MEKSMQNCLSWPGPLWVQGGGQTGGVPKSGLCATEESTHLDQYPVGAHNSCSALRVKIKIKINNVKQERENLSWSLGIARKPV